MSLSRAAFLPLLLAAAAFAAETGSGLPKNSPFIPVGTPGTAAPAANENVEFAGVSLVGKKTDLIFYDKSAKKNYWIGIGETKEGIAVLNYDARREQAVVKINGAEKTLPLRKGRGPVNTPAPVAPMPVGFNIPAPAVTPAPNEIFVPVQKIQPAPPPSVAMPGPAGTPTAPVKADGASGPETQQKQETEARMLVSDLLEIGMAQRKAYEDAQRKAAEGKNQPQAAETPAPGQPGKPNGN